MTVLDVGCGAGAITLGIAEAVGANGSVVGLDRDASLLALVPEHPNLTFEQGDVLTMGFEVRFDVVSAARVLQWISQPGEAIARMRRGAKRGGLVVALDYNHANHQWDPEPPGEFQQFWSAFLTWRSDNGWDNHMADHLPELFRAAGLDGVAVYDDDQMCERGQPDFAADAAIWIHVADTIGPRFGAALGPDYAEWVRTRLRRQRLEMRTVVGVSP